MNYADAQHTHVLTDRLGLKLAGVLASVEQEMPYDVSERLRAARVQAVSKRKLQTASPVVLQNGATAALIWAEQDRLGFWRGLGSILPLVALVLGLMIFKSVQDDERVIALAAVDTALLIDDLPPQAYSDPGFVQFLKHSH
ncbi:MAG: hypothetical protein RL758_1057 [Pseudomonadota bacterium]|jgi:hypothetical protein